MTTNRNGNTKGGLHSTRIVLDGKDFKQLLTGGVVTKYSDNVRTRIVLSDIGYMEIARIVSTALGIKIQAPERVDELHLRLR